jgi:hypothetical protein
MNRDNAVAWNKQQLDSIEIPSPSNRSDQHLSLDLRFNFSRCCPALIRTIKRFESKTSMHI